MTKNIQFNSRRTGLLLRNEFLRGSKNILIIAGAVTGVLLIINVASGNTADQWDFHSVFFPITLLIGGIIAASRSFSVLYNKQKGIEYLLLPASMFEKFVAKLIFSTVGYILMALAGYFIFSLIGSGLSFLAFGRGHGVFNPFTREVWQMIALYVATSSVVFFGSVYFKKLPLVKTILMLCGIAIGYAVLSAVIFRFLFWGFFDGFILVNDEMMNLFRIQAGMSAQFMNFFENLYSVLKVIFWFIVPAFFWVLTFLRLRETEVR